MPDQQKKRLCFIIGPIGKEDSEARNNADMLVEYVIRPVLEPMNYRVQRADKITNPGTITDQVVNHVLDADLVIADLSGHNPNAFYELGLRHREDKPTIHLIVKGEVIPFDVSDVRAISYSLKNPTSIGQARDDLRQQVDAIGRPDYTVSNPITRARGIRQLTESTDSTERLLADLISEVRDLKNRVDTVESIADSAWTAAGGVPRAAGLGLGIPIDYQTYGSLARAAAGIPDSGLPGLLSGAAMALDLEHQRLQQDKLNNALAGNDAGKNDPGKST